MIIKYLKHNEINKSKWDNCVENSVNCMVYGMSWYLDVVCENWDALVSNDYESVMPLPWKNKLGIKYIYHPFFAQQLGLFYQNEEENKVDEFLAAIPCKFLKYEFSLNSFNFETVIKYKKCDNYLLSLHKPYDEILASYDTKCRRNVKLSKLEQVFLNTNIPVDTFLKFKLENMTNYLSERHSTTITTLFNFLLIRQQAKIIGIYNSNNNLLGAAAFVFYKNRITYLFSASNEEGKNKRVMYRILNYIIEQHSGTNLILDFEGSMIESIARFFKGFGAISENYYRIQKSRIPFVK